MKLTYRPEIDGLRAIAIISVILYHLKINFEGHNIFAGGFIGVDIFFVISGYLITSLILKELEITGKFSFLHFYERRARRILPALFVVILTSLPFAWMYLLPNNFADFAKSILSTLAFVSNFYFYFIGESYWGDNSLQPFLHTWSLAVEEQFYVIGPIVIVLLFKFFRSYVLIIFIAGALLSLLAADLGSIYAKSLTFYSLPTRAWELLAGSILAKLELRYERKHFGIVNQILPILGLFLIFYYFIYIFNVIKLNEEIIHPSFTTALPVIGTMLIIWFSHKDDLAGKILSSQIFVKVGLISYSLYLWHSPIFTFNDYVGFVQKDASGKILLIFLTIVLSTLTFLFIEKPFRNKSKIILSKLLIYLSASLLLLTSVSACVVYKDGFKKKYNTVYENIFGKELLNLKKNTKFDLIKAYYVEERLEFLKKSGIPNFIDDDRKNILIVGNSHAEDLFNIFKLNENLINKYETSLFRFQPNHQFRETNVYDFEDFLLKKKNVNEKSISLYKNSDIIVFNTRWNYDDLEKLEKIIFILKKENKKIILVTSAAEFPIINNNFKLFTIIDSFVYKNKRLPDLKEKIKIEKEYYLKRNIDNKDVNIINNRLKKIAKKNNIALLNSNDYLCNEEEQRCDFFTDNNEKISFDYGHYSIAGARYLGKKISKMDWFKQL